MTRSKLVQIRCTEQEKAYWEEAAGVQSLSAWLRMLANREVRVANVVAAEKGVLDQLSGVEQPVAREAHTLKVAGSSPAPATFQRTGTTPPRSAVREFKPDFKKGKK